MTRSERQSHTNREEQLIPLVLLSARDSMVAFESDIENAPCRPELQFIRHSIGVVSPCPDTTLSAQREEHSGMRLHNGSSGKGGRWSKRPVALAVEMK